MYVCMHICMHIYVCMYVCMYACMYTYMYVCIYVCICYEVLVCNANTIYFSFSSSPYTRDNIADMLLPVDVLTEFTSSFLVAEMVDSDKHKKHRS